MSHVPYPGLAVFAFLPIVTVKAQPILYVDQDATGANDGSSWLNAYDNLQDALGHAAEPDSGVTEIRVAQGVYKPDQGRNQTPGDREATSQLINGVGIYGGYAGVLHPGDPDRRDLDAYETILSGDLDGNDNPNSDMDPWDDPTRSDNSYHVVVGSGTDDTAELDGFIITAGNANGERGPTNPYIGGGMFNDSNSTPRLTNCTFRGNSASYGGGMYNNNASPTLANCTFIRNLANFGGGILTGASPTLTNCAFAGNMAKYGGGILTIDSTATLTNCLFTGNFAELGGGIYSILGKPMLTNCTFMDNSAQADGGGVYSRDAAPTLVNCLVTDNSAPRGGGIYCHGSPKLTNCTFTRNSAESYGAGIYMEAGSGATLTNSIFWANRSVGEADESAQIYTLVADSLIVSYTCIQGLDSLAGNGNTGEDPHFVDADGPDDLPGTEDDNLRLPPHSPCVDAGDNEAVPEDSADLDADGNTVEPIPYDLDGSPRFLDTSCKDDLGNPHQDFPDLEIVDMGAYEYQESLNDDPDEDGAGGCSDNCPLQWNPGQADCDEDGLGDVCALTSGASKDCNNNLKPDECDLADGTSLDEDHNGKPDECQLIILVDDDAPLGGDGTSWNSAYRFLQNALAAATIGDKIRVAGGIYNAAQNEGLGLTEDRSVTFQLINTVGIYGGYAGFAYPDNPDHRDIHAYETILSGDLDGNDVADLNGFLACFTGSWQDLEPGCEAYDLDGDGDVDLVDGHVDENSRHVVTGTYTDHTAVLDGVTITSGHALASLDCGGGGMYNKEGSPTLINCTLAANSGGGMYNRLGNPALVNCAFTENSGRGMCNSGGDPTLVNCTFAGNAGGGMYSYYGYPTLANCTFSGNSAREVGGGIHVWEGGATLTNCTFSGNTAAELGGGVSYGPGIPTLVNCILWANRDARGTEESSQIASIYRYPPTVSYTCIQGLDSLAGNGNVGENPLFVDADGPDDVPGTDDDDLRLWPRSRCIDAGDNEAVSEDSVDLDGDGVTTEPLPYGLDGNPRFLDAPCATDVGDPHPDFPDMDIVDMGAYEYQESLDDDPDEDGVTGCTDNCPLHWNAQQADCDEDGLGDVCALALDVSQDCNHNLVPDGCDMADGTSSDEDDNHIPDECQRIIFVDDDASPGGTGATWNSAYKHLQDALADAVDGDQIHVAGGTYKADRDEAGNVAGGDRTATFQIVNGVRIYGGYAGLAYPDNPDHRDIHAYETILSGDLDGDDVADLKGFLACFTGTWSDYEPGCEAFDLEGDGDVDAVDGCIDENSYHVVTGAYTDDTAVLDGVTITSGNADGYYYGHSRGGGMFNELGSPTLTNCTFTGNSARSTGGGIYSNGDPTLTNCTFGENLGDYGGGIYSGHHGSPTLANCVFTQNSATRGGGMFSASHSTPTLTDCTFSLNSATEDGGGMYNDYDGSPTLTNCAFTQNSATRGGGMFGSVGSTTTLTGCRFSLNSATQGGGGMYNLANSPALGKCRFIGNSAEMGGGMYNDQHGRPTLANCVFSGNSAALYGGGIYNYHSSNPTFVNCTLSGNRAEHGKGIACDSDGPDEASTVQLHNSILWNSGDEIWNNDGSTITVTYTSVQDEDSDDGAVHPGEGNIDDDPLFADPDGQDDIPGTEDDDLHLLPGSPCIDAGDNGALPGDITTDFDGNPRFVDDPDTPDTAEGVPPIVDMGAYEYQPPLSALLNLDIRPGSCPNRLALKGREPLRMAIVATEAFDVADVDADSLVLTRADGFGGEVTPITRPPGLSPKVRDVATPFDGEPCDCHRLRRDGVDDLLLRFATVEMVDSLELYAVPDGESVLLTLLLHKVHRSECRFS